MADEVTRHYDALLAENYVWMFGVPFVDKVEEQRGLLASLGFGGSQRGLAIDLGCGPGFQALALAKLGYAKVVAVDTSKALLDELTAHRGALPVEAVEADMRDLPALVAAGSAAAVVCMGDTLTHLPSRADVSRLLANIGAALAPGGLLALTFRDLSVPLLGTDRIVPVRSDPDRIMICVLDYEPETVVVTDVIHNREGEGWRTAKSSYRKLRLSPAEVAGELGAIGFDVLHNAPVGRLHSIVAQVKTERV